MDNPQSYIESGRAAEYAHTYEDRVDAGRKLVLRSKLPNLMVVLQSIEAAHLGTIAGVPRPTGIDR